MQQLVGDLCRRHGPATLLVTHDVEEAILLADRALVLRDGRIAVDVPIALSHPRKAGGAVFDALRNRLLAELGIEIDHPEAHNIFTTEKKSET
jgi:sulfonate transport system ATP-binding protein